MILFAFWRFNPIAFIFIKPFTTPRYKGIGSIKAVRYSFEFRKLRSEIIENYQPVVCAFYKASERFQFQFRILTA